MGEGRAVSILSPRVLQAFLWPVHNVFLCTWIALILATTYLGSLLMMCQTLLFGAKRTNAPLGRLFMEEVHPGARAVEALCEQHQAIGVRVAGLALMPLMMLCDLSTSVVGRMGVLAGSLVFVGLGICSWWYWVRWFFVLLCILHLFDLDVYCMMLLEQHSTTTTSAKLIMIVSPTHLWFLIDVYLALACGMRSLSCRHEWLVLWINWAGRKLNRH